MELSTYILTGGKSSRMGNDKALMLLNGSSFLNQISKATAHLNAEITLVSSNKKHQNLGFRTIEDIAINKGPVAAITSALSDSKTDLSLILSCDIPLLKSALIDLLSEQHKNEFDATFYVVNGKKMPLVGLYKKRCLPSFEKALKNEDLKLMNVISTLHTNCMEAPTDLAYQLSNINTPEQAKEALQWL